MSTYDIIIRILASIFVGGIVGIQREQQHNSAGFRTHVLVSLGACVAMLTNEYLFHKFSSISSMDIARMGSYVISGIGFLGAGIIIKDGTHIRGLTTAAGLWVVAVLGIAAGAGFYLAALSGSVISFIVIALLKKYETRIFRKKNLLSIDMSIKNTSGQLANVLSIISTLDVSIKDVKMSNTEGKWLDVVIITTIPNKLALEKISVLMDNTKGIKLNSFEEI